MCLALGTAAGVHPGVNKSYNSVPIQVANAWSMSVESVEMVLGKRLGQGGYSSLNIAWKEWIERTLPG
jgi:hypothetical protein